jgi:hypothetical protein
MYNILCMRMAMVQKCYLRQVSLSSFVSFIPEDCVGVGVGMLLDAISGSLLLPHH